MKWTSEAGFLHSLVTEMICSELELWRWLEETPITSSIAMVWWAWKIYLLSG